MRRENGTKRLWRRAQKFAMPLMEGAGRVADAAPDHARKVARAAAQRMDEAMEKTEELRAIPMAGLAQGRRAAREQLVIMLPSRKHRHLRPLGLALVLGAAGAYLFDPELGSDRRRRLLERGRRALDRVDGATSEPRGVALRAIRRGAQASAPANGRRHASTPGRAAAGDAGDSA